MTDHDGLYHGLFSHPVLVRQLLEAFVPPEWFAGLDLDRMERLNVSFHEALKGRRRTGDVIWRLPGLPGNSGLYLCVLLEFQSTDERMMAVRTLVYQGLLWQQLAAEKQLGRDGLLPPVLTLVLYNGDERWRSPTEVRELVGLGSDSPLWPWQPQARYHLLDMGLLGEYPLPDRDNLAALLVRLESGQGDPEELIGLIDDLLGWFRRHPGHDMLMRLFALLVREAVQTLDPPAAVPNDMREMKNMLATATQRWKARLIEESKAEGLALGHAEGHAEGQAVGRAEGRIQGQAEILLRMLRRRFGEVPEALEARVLAGSSGQIEDWSDRLFEAASLDDLFRGESAN